MNRKNNRRQTDAEEVYAETVAFPFRLFQILPPEQAFLLAYLMRCSEKENAEDNAGWFVRHHLRVGVWLACRRFYT